MAIFLVQHAKSLPKEADPEKGISPEGKADAARIAEVARGYRVKVSLIRHSGKKRAQQTSEIFGAALNPERGIEEGQGLNPLDDVTAVATELQPEDNLMLVGHLPFMEKLTSYLITGSSDKPVFKFQNAGIVCLDKLPDTDDWVIRWTLMPEIG